jgi:hypothetical protein
MYARVLPLPGFCLFSILSACDLLLTWLLLQWPTGEFREGNPIASAWLHCFGWTGLIAYKVLMSITFLGACLFVAYTQHRKKADRLVMSGCLVIGCVLAYSYYLIQVETHP